MFGLPGGKGIMAFCDTAGGNACLSLAYMLGKEGSPIPVLYTNNKNFLKNDWGLQVNFIHDMEEIPGSLHGDYLFTGTSHPDSSKCFELKFIQAAKRLNVPSVSFIDHWVNFKIRFILDSEIVYPDQIWVLDETAKAAALIDGLPDEKLVIHENPQHLFLRKYWQPEFPGNEYLHHLGIEATSENKVILFAPDPVSLRYKENELLFDEVSALKLIVQILSGMEDPLFQPILIIKPHPLQEEKKLEEALQSIDPSNFQYRVIKKADNRELINCADIVIGFYSNFLLEAQHLQKKVLRYFPGPPSADPLQHFKEKLPALDEKTLYTSLKNAFING